MAATDLFAVARRMGFADPRQVAAGTAALTRWGPTLASIYGAAALRRPRAAAVIDHRGTVSFSQLDRSSTELAKGLRALGLQGGDHIGILCFNHRDFVATTVAAAKGGWPCVYLNTGFGGPQLAEVCAREQVAAVVVDRELLHVVATSGFDGPVIVADSDGGDLHEGLETLATVRARQGRGVLLPAKPTQPILLTSGTTGTPKGARRSNRLSGMSSATGLVERIPYRADETFVIPTPIFHAWGAAQLVLAAVTGSTAVLVRRFDPQRTMDAVVEHRAEVLAVVPVMLQRILADPALRDHDTSSLRITACSGSALPAQVGLDWMDAFGDNLYNVYGSTEVGQATIATPEDLRAAPGTAGRPARGSTVRIVDDRGAPVEPGAIGRIVVGNDAQFDHYTGGGTKERVDGLMSSGDVGFVDGDGRLFVTGRADDMIISGGENVFPGEVEELLLTHDGITDAAVIGVADDDFGQRLAAYVVVIEGGDVDEDAVREFVAAQLARHKVPRDVVFVEEIPRTTTGKIRRRDLG